MSKTHSIHIQWIPAHINLPGNTLADSEDKRGNTLTQSTVPINMTMAKSLIQKTGHRPTPTSGKASSPYRATTVSGVSTLRRQRQADILLHCPSVMQARNSTNFINSSNSRFKWSFLESTGAVTCPPPRPGMRVRERKF